MNLLNIISLCMASLGLRCCRGLSLVTVSGSYSSVAVRRPLVAVASPAAERGLRRPQVSAVANPGLKSAGSVVVAHRLSCSTWNLPGPRIEPMPPGMGGRTLNPCTTREVPNLLIFTDNDLDS